MFVVIVKENSITDSLIMLIKGIVGKRKDGLMDMVIKKYLLMAKKLENIDT